MTDMLEQLIKKVNALQTKVAELERLPARPPSNVEALGRAVSMFLSIPGLSAFYPGVIRQNTSGTPQVKDLSSNGLHLTIGSVGSTQGGGELFPFVNFSGSNYAYRADTSPLDITGGESYPASQLRGITIGGWFRPNAAVGSNEVLLSKGGSGTTRNYQLTRLAAGNAQFSIGSSSVIYNVQHTVLNQNEWAWVVGRFDPSTIMYCHVNQGFNPNSTSIPATADTNSEPLVIGARSDGAGGFTVNFTGYAAFCFVAQCFLPGSLVDALYYYTKALVA